MKLEPKHFLLIAAMVLITLFLAWFVWPTPYKNYSYHYEGIYSIIKENRITHSVYTKFKNNDTYAFNPYFYSEHGNECNYKFGIIVCRK